MNVNGTSCPICFIVISNPDRLVECDYCTSKVCEICVLRHYANEKTRHEDMSCVSNCMNSRGVCFGYYPNPTKEI